MRNNFYKSFRHFPHFYILPLTHIWSFSVGFPGGSVGKESTCNQLPNHLGLIPGSGKSPGGGHGNPLQYSCWENPMDRGAWRATVHGVTKSQTSLCDLTLLSGMIFLISLSDSLLLVHRNAVDFYILFLYL